MASFSEHLNQVNKNLIFLERTNARVEDSWDWQVTSCFYVAVHLANAHIANKLNEHYRSHEKVSDALNPFKVLSPTKLPEQIYLAYTKLQGLSRRSRYLCHEDNQNYATSGHFTFDKHLAKSIKKLDILLEYFAKEYTITFDTLNIDCIDLKNSALTYFKYQAVSA